MLTAWTLCQILSVMLQDDSPIAKDCNNEMLLQVGFSNYKAEGQVELEI